MLETFLYYILPNVMLFGGIFVFCKAVEILVQFTIDYPMYIEEYLIDTTLKRKK
jgi:hypothetical protein